MTRAPLRMSPALRTLLLLALVAALALSACSPINPNQTQQQFSEPVRAGILSGNVTFDRLQTLPEGAVVEVEVLDLSVPVYPMSVFARTSFEAGGFSSPLPYQVLFDTDEVKPTHDYVVGARVIVDDKIAWITPTGIPVLTNGTSNAGIDVDIIELPDEPLTQGKITGNVIFTPTTTLPPEAQVIIELIDRTDLPYQTVGRQSILMQDKVSPIDFVVDYDPTQINEEHIYGISARVVDGGKLAYVVKEPLAVLTAGAPKDQVDVILEKAVVEESKLLRPLPRPMGLLDGRVVLMSSQPLPDGAMLEVEVFDTTDESGNVRVDSTAFSVEGISSPIAWEIQSEVLIDPARTYAVSARIRAGANTLHTSKEMLPVLTQGSPATALTQILAEIPQPTATPTPLPTATPIRTPTPTPVPGAITSLTTVTGDGVLSGSVTSEDRLTLPPDAQLTIELSELLDGEPILIGSTTVAAGGRQLPIPFAVEFQPSLIVPNGDYEARARIESEAGLLFESSTGTPALTGGAGAVGIEVPVRVLEGVELEPLQGVAADDLTVGARVSWPDGAALPEGALVEVQLLDLTTTPFAVVAQARQDASGATSPVNVELTFSDAGPSRLNAYALGARILVNGEPLWATARLMPLNQAGSPREQVELLALAAGGAGEVPAQGVAAGAEASGTPGATPVASPSASASPSPEPSVTPTPSPTPDERTGSGSVIGDIVTQSGEPLPQGALVTVWLSQEATADAEEQVLAVQIIEADGESPPRFDLAYAANAIDEARDYAVYVQVSVDNEVVSVTDEGFPVLTGGAPGEVTVTVDLAP